MPDGRNVESGGADGGGVEVNHGGGAYQSQFDHHMWLPGSGDGVVPPVPPNEPGTTGTPDAQS